MAAQKPKICLVSCSVLKRELQQLKAQGKLDAELVFVSKNFHVDYALARDQSAQSSRTHKETIQRQNRAGLRRPLFGARQRNEKARRRIRRNQGGRS